MRAIKGYSNYLINEDGDVFKKGSMKPIKKHMNKSGHMKYFLISDCGIKNCNAYVHRLVYSAYVKEIPDGMNIDHIDGNPLNNNVKNLRECTHFENIRFHVLKKRKRGVIYHPDTVNHKRKKRWQAVIWIYGIGAVSIGYFKEKKDAYEAYNNVFKEWYGQEAF